MPIADPIPVRPFRSPAIPEGLDSTVGIFAFPSSFTIECKEFAGWSYKSPGNLGLEFVTVDTKADPVSIHGRKGASSGVVAGKGIAAPQVLLPSAVEFSNTSRVPSEWIEGLRKIKEAIGSFVEYPARLWPTYEESYQLIGWRKGVNASPRVRKNVREFWTGSGRHGAEWLIRRVAGESHNDILDGVANILADIGVDSIGPIVQTLGGMPQPSRDQSEVLLKALAWIEAPTHVVALSNPRLEGELARFLGHADPDLREAACHAIRHLPDDRANPILSARRDVETNPDVLDAITEAIGRD